MRHTWPRNLSLKLCQSEFWPLPEDVPFCLPLPCMHAPHTQEAHVMTPLFEVQPHIACDVIMNAVG